MKTLSYIKKTKIDGIGKYRIFDSFIAIKAKEGIKIYDNGLNKVIKFFPMSDPEVDIVFYNKFFISTRVAAKPYGFNIIYDYEGIKIAEKSNFYFNVFHDLNNYIGYDSINKITEGEKYRIYLEGILGKIILKNGVIVGQLYKENISPLRYVIIGYDTNEKHLLWQFDISQFGKYREGSEERQHDFLQFVGVHKNLVWVLLKGGILIALDISNGTQRHQIDFSKVFGKPYHPLAEMYLDEVNNRIIWLTGALIHIDLDTLECKIVKDFFNVSKEEHWWFRSYSFFKDSLYFVGDLGSTSAFATWVGIMDANTGEVFWHERLKCALPNAPVACENRFYVLDGKCTLHVFKEEK